MADRIGIWVFYAAAVITGLAAGSTIFDAISR